MDHQGVDLVLMDIRMPEMDGIECLGILKRKAPEMNVVVFTGYATADYLRRSMAAGADGYLVKPSSARELWGAIDFSLAGGFPVSRCMRPHFSANSGVPDPASWDESLSDEDNKLMTALARGMMYKEIADQLHLSAAHVKKHLHRVFVKFHAQNRTEAVQEWDRHRVQQGRTGGSQAR
jgi:DNA-binding NarL/FixJ family response regulator